MGEVHLANVAEEKMIQAMEREKKEVVVNLPSSVDIPILHLRDLAYQQHLDSIIEDYPGFDPERTWGAATAAGATEEEVSAQGKYSDSKKEVKKSMLQRILTPTLSTGLLSTATALLLLFPASATAHTFINEQTPLLLHN